MAKLSVREAAQRYDVSRPTLVKHIKSGKISADVVDKDKGGGWLIDPSELDRSGYALRLDPVKPAADLPGSITGLAVGLPVNDGAEIAALKAALAEAERRAALAEALAAERAAHIEDLRRMLPAPDAKPKRRWWTW